MPRPSLHPDVALDVHLTAIMSRHQHDHDPTVCLEELRRVARGRNEPLTAAIAGWVAWYRAPHTEALSAALLDAYPAAAAHPMFTIIADRRRAPMHGAPPRRA